MKGQIWSLDFITSVTIFILVLIPLIFIWAFTTTHNAEQNMIKDLQLLAISVSDMLVRTPGIPKQWTPENVKVIGLSLDENILNKTKVDFFINMGNSEYEKVKALLTGGYDFYFNVEYINGSIYAETGKKIENGNNIPVTRYCIMNGKIVKMKFALVTE